jgi:hypothetical protein
LEGREADDEVMFKKRYKEYVQENKEIVREYRERGLLVEVDTGKGMEESWEKLFTRLEKDVKWTDVISKEGLEPGGEEPVERGLDRSSRGSGS